MALLGAELCQNAIQAIPKVSSFDLPDFEVKTLRETAVSKNNSLIPTPNKRKFCEKFPLFVAGDNYELRDPSRTPMAKGLRASKRLKKKSDATNYSLNKKFDATNYASFDSAIFLNIARKRKRLTVDFTAKL